MSQDDSIRLSLNIKDPNITFDENYLNLEVVKKVQTLVYKGKLSLPVPDHCPHCGSLTHDHSIIRHGFKSSDIVLPDVSNMRAILRLRKQRFLCKDCGTTFSAETGIVQKNCFISNNTRTAIVLESKKKISQKDIAERMNVSHGTVNSMLSKIYDQFFFNRNFLPKHLCFDEFKAVKELKGKMAFLVINAENGDVINVLEDRYQSSLIKYFMSYSKAARGSVKTVCMDMHSPYMNVVKSCFPNAKIIIDRFHIVQLLSRSLNQTRRDTMSSNRKHAKKLKKYWRLILKNENDLNDSEFKNYAYYEKQMRETDIVNDLLSISDELKATYELYQELIQSLSERKWNKFNKALTRKNDKTSSHMKTSVKSLLGYKDGIKNAFKYTYSNGRIEGTNNLIKVIKRIAFGYRSFVSFKVRILLICNTLVPITPQKKETLKAS